MAVQLIATNRTVFDPRLPNKDQLGVAATLRFGRFDFDPEDDGETDVFTPFPEGNSSYSDCLKLSKESINGYARFFRELYDLTQASGKEILLFIHGYRHPVDRLQRTIRRLQKFYVNDKKCNIDHIVMLSWPSTEETGEYTEDRQRAKETGKVAFREFLEEWRNFLQQAFDTKEDAVSFAAKFNVAAASMGNRLLQETADYFSHDGEPLVNELIHTAADVGISQFQLDKPLRRLSKIARRVHVYFNHGDLVLDLSTIFENHLEMRLGKHGPAWGTPDDSDIIYVDVTAAVALAAADPSVILNPGDEADFPVIHTYFIKAKQVVADVKRVLSHNEEFPGRVGIFNRERLLPLLHRARFVESKEETKEAIDALYDANALFAVELYEVHSSLLIFRIIGINVERLKAQGKEFLNYSSLLSQRTIVLGIESLFERGSSKHKLCSMKGVWNLAKKVSLKNKDALDEFIKKYDIQSSGDWRADVENVLVKNRDLVRSCMKHTSEARNTRLAHLSQQTKTLTAPPIKEMELLIEFAHDFHLFISRGFLDGSGVQLPDRIGKSLFTMMRDKLKIENVQFDFDEATESK